MPKEIVKVTEERHSDESALAKIKNEGGHMLAFVYFVPTTDSVGKLKIAESQLSSELCEQIAASFMEISLKIARSEGTARHEQN